MNKDVLNKEIDVILSQIKKEKLVTVKMGAEVTRLQKYYQHRNKIANSRRTLDHTKQYDGTTSIMAFVRVKCAVYSIAKDDARAVKLAFANLTNAIDRHIQQIRKVEYMGTVVCKLRALKRGQTNKSLEDLLNFSLQR